MNMLDVHALARQGAVPVLHEFKLRYSKDAHVVYGFVEGKQDPCFYRGFVDHVLPEGWEVELWPAGSRNNVYQLYANLDWRCFPKRRVCFFVDRDLSDLLQEQLQQDDNIYITPGYSIENEAATKGVCKRVLSEVFGLSIVSHDELDAIGELFQEQLESFFKAMIPVMAWILHWRTGKKTASLSNIEMKHMFSIDKGVLASNATPKQRTNVVEYMHAQCDVPFDSRADITSCMAICRLKKNYQRFTRGKYVLWFVVEFCRSIHSSAPSFFSSVAKQPRVNVVLSQGNAVTLVAPRCRVPASLRRFLNVTFCAYIHDVESMAKRNK